jgi:HD-like signal output (HDOD) protein
VDQGIGRWFGGKNGTRRPPGQDGSTPTSTPTPSATRTPAASRPGTASASASANAPNTPPRELSAEERALQQELTRTLEGRCDVLTRAAGVDTKASDAGMVIECLRRLDETVIRQPPIAAQRALAVAKNPTSSSAELVAIFEQDPALTEALLQMANSNYYHRGNDPCIAISEAIARVGVRGVEAIVTTNMVEGLLCRPGNAYATLLSQVWAHMTRTAPIARALAPAFKSAPETAFTVGLLHDVGKLMMFDYLSQLRTRHRREIKVPERFLLDMLNRLHEPLGGIAALRWNLGATVAHAIASHHHEPPPEMADLLSELLCVSERADHSLRLGVPLDVWKIWRDGELTADPHEGLALVAKLPNVQIAGPDGGKTGTSRAAA